MGWPSTFGGAEYATALVWCTEDLRVGCWIETAEDAILRAAEKARELRATHPVQEFVDASCAPDRPP